MFILSGFLDEYSSDFTEQLEGAKRLEMHNIELRFVDGVNVANLSEEKVNEIKVILKKENVRVSAIGSPIGKISLDDDFDEHLDTAEKIFKTAKELDCKLIRIFSFYLNGRTREESFELVVKRLQKLLNLADKFSLTLCLENEEGLYGESPESCLELCEYFKGKLRTVFDMGNFLLCGYEPYKVAYDLLKEYIEYFHIKDALKDGAIVPCGEGDAEIEKILKDYKSNYPNKNVYVSSEPHLVDFVGLSDLATHNLKKKISFEDEKQAFVYACGNLVEMINRI